MYGHRERCFAKEAKISICKADNESLRVCEFDMVLQHWSPKAACMLKRCRKFVRQAMEL